MGSYRKAPLSQYTLGLMLAAPQVLDQPIFHLKEDQSFDYKVFRNEIKVEVYENDNIKLFSIKSHLDSNNFTLARIEGVK